MIDQVLPVMKFIFYAAAVEGAIYLAARCFMAGYYKSRLEYECRKLQIERNPNYLHTARKGLI